MDMNSILVLENGAVFRGTAITASGGEKIGKVVLNTSVVGYQELVTDTTNAGKILVLTYPLIGNYGINRKFNESKGAWIAGLAIKELSNVNSNWMSEGSLGSFLEEQHICGISDVDTRTITINIRDQGEMYGVISNKDFNKERLIRKIKSFKAREKSDYIGKISVVEVTEIRNPKARLRVCVYDLGINNSFVRQLLKLGLEVVLVPYNTDSKEVLKLKPNGVIISNGPEEDVALPEVVDVVKSLLGRIPILGFATGHLVLSRALGAKIKKMRVGHHGVNYPLKRKGSLKGEISVQNHSWVVDAKSVNRLKKVKIYENNLNDNTVESIVSDKLKIISVQYYPTTPGFAEINDTFLRFFELLQNEEKHAKAKRH